MPRISKGLLETLIDISNFSNQLQNQIYEYETSKNYDTFNSIIQTIELYKLITRSNLSIFNEMIINHYDDQELANKVIQELRTTTITKGRERKERIYEPYYNREERQD